MERQEKDQQPPQRHSLRLRNRSNSSVTPTSPKRRRSQSPEFAPPAAQKKSRKATPTPPQESTSPTPPASTDSHRPKPPPPAPPAHKKPRRGRAKKQTQQMESHDEDRDDHDETGIESLDQTEHSELSSLATAQALRNILRQLGGGLLYSDSRSSSRLQSLVQSLQSSNPSEVSAALNELCDILSVGSEGGVSSAIVTVLVPRLISIIADGDFPPEVELLAVRALTNLMETTPSSRELAVSCGIGPHLCAKLLSIEFIDLAEESLHAIEKLSNEQANHLLECETIMAVLSFVDFFSTPVQRSALQTVANLTKHINASHFSSIQSCIPQLANFLSYSDMKILELVSVSFDELSNKFSSDPAALHAIIVPQAVKSFIDILKRTDSLPAQIHTSITRTLSAAVKSSAELQQLCVGEGVIDCVCTVLRMNVVALDGQPRTANQSRSPVQVQELLSLVSDILPPLPPENVRQPRRRSSRQAQAEPEQNVSHHALVNNPELRAKYASELLETAILVYDHSINLQVRSLCRLCVLKTIHLCDGDVLSSAISTLRIASFIASLVCGTDVNAQYDGLRLVSLLLTKLQNNALRDLIRVGVTHHCKNLAEGTATAQRTVSDVADRFGTLLRSPVHSLVYENPPTPLSSHTATPSRRASRSRDSTPQITAESVRTLAQSVCEQFPVTADTTPIVDQLKQIAQNLLSAQDEQTLKNNLESLASLLSSPGVTVFEFTTSDIVTSLLRVLNTGDACSVLSRVQLLVDVWGKVELKEKEDGETDRIVVEPPSMSLLHLLVRNVVHSLEKTEVYPLLVHSLGTDTAAQNDSFSSLKALTQPLKIRLQRVSGETNVKEFPTAAIMIEPMAPITAIEEFLFPKVAMASPTALSIESVELPGPSSSTPHRNRTKSLRSSQQPPSEQDNDDNDGAMEVEVEDADLSDCDELSAVGREDQSMPSPMLDLSKSPAVDSSNSPHPPRPSPSHRSGTPTHRSSDTPSATTPTSSAAAQIKTKPQKLVFLFGGFRLEHSTSVFQVIHNYVMRSSAEPLLQSIWNETHVIQYCSPQSGVPEASAPFTPELRYKKQYEQMVETQNNLTAPSSDAHTTRVMQLVSRPVLWPSLPEDSTTNMLYLLRILYNVATRWHIVMNQNYNSPSLVPLSEFLSVRLTSKIGRQLDDPLTLCASSLPQWCHAVPVICPFLFSFDVRAALLVSTAHGIPRALHAFVTRHQQASEAQNVRVARIQRQKVRVQRSKILDSAIKVMSQHASASTILEVEYDGEVGTGSGPTMEFFALVAQKLKEKSLRLWIDDGDRSSEFVNSPNGLFPRPLPFINSSSFSTQIAKATEMFRFVGRLTAKAIMDGRLTELPLSAVFVRMVVGEEVWPHDLHAVVPHIAKTIDQLRQLSTSTDEFLLNGVPLSDLCLSFVLPDNDDVMLIDNGHSIGVDATNVREYTTALVNAYLGDGVARQVAAFREGFQSVFALSHLLKFHSAEVETLVCGDHRQLSMDALTQYVKADHGYTLTSPAIQTLFEVLNEMDAAEQRRFVSFVTGSPRLPPGGLANLNPRLTVVRKSPEFGRVSDDYLPSVMTCANYLKLPDYSGKEVMRQRLSTAISEGQGSFHLS